MNTMEFKKVLSSGILSTLAMTLFSYWVSELMNENFREPEIMTILINNLSLIDKQYVPYFRMEFAFHYWI